MKLNRVVDYKQYDPFGAKIKKVNFIKSLAFLVLTIIIFNSFSIPQKSPEEVEIDRLLSEAWQLWQQNKIDEAREKFKITLTNSKKINYKNGIGYSSFYLASSQMEVDPYEAYNLGLKALEVAEEIEDKVLKSYSANIIGQALFYLGKSEEALLHHENALNLFKELNNVIYEISTLIKISTAKSTMNEHSYALNYAKIALDKAREINNKYLIVEALGTLAQIHISLNEVDKAIDFLNQAININKEVKDLFLEYKMKSSLGFIFVKKGEYEEAERIYIECYEYYRDNNLIINEAISLHSLGVVNFSLGRYEKSLEFFNRSSEIFLKTKTSSGLVATYVSLASYYIKLSEFSKANETLEEALRISKREGLTYLEPLIYRTLGDLSLEVGNFSKAEKYINYALKSIELIKDEKAKKDNLITLGKLLIDSGYHNYYYGNLSKALEYYLKARSIFEELDNDEYLKELYHQVAYLYLSLGDYEKALSYAMKFYDIARSQKPTEIYIRNLILTSLIYSQLNNKKESLKNLNQALSLSKELGDKKIESYCLNEMGRYFLLKGNFVISKRFFNRGLNLLNKTKDISLIADIYDSMALYYFLLAQNQKSYEYVNKAIEINSKIMNKRKLQYEYYLIGKALSELKKEKDAIHYLKKSEEIMETLRVRIKEKSYMSNFLDRFPVVYEELIAMLETLSTRENDINLKKEAFIYSEKGRARQLLDILGEAKLVIKSKIPKDILEKHNLLYAKIGKLKELYLGTEEMEEKEKIRNKIVKLEEELRDIELKHLKPNQEFSQISYPKQINIRFVQNEILKNNKCAILEYYIGIENAFVFVITKKDFKLIRLNIYGFNLAEEIIKLRKPFENIKKGSFLINELKKFDVKLANKLYKELVLPVIPYLMETEHIIIIPHMSLNYLPFEMLLSQIGEKSIEDEAILSEYRTHRYLFEDYSISYAPSVSVLDPKLLKRVRVKSSKGDILAIANPQFEKQVSYEPEESLSNVFLTKSIRKRIEQLPHSEQEAIMIQKCFNNASVYLSKKATENNFISQAPNYPIIHLSTHGFLNETNPIYSFLVFAYNEEIKDVDLLHAYEIFNLDLNCDLVTLSACESGLGQEIETIGGEGVVGLSRAFLYAGAKSLVVSLWQVLDESTSILMSEFYRNLREKEFNKVEALRQAKLYLMKEQKKIGNRYISYSHPFFWAPFILIGDSN